MRNNNEDKRKDGRDEVLVIVGASTRAAAFSALRAGLRPWCADRYADLDLASVCPVVRLPKRNQAKAALSFFGQAPHGPWMYTGALENQPNLVSRLAQTKHLWGNDEKVIRRIRQPWTVAYWLKGQQVHCPDVCRSLAAKSENGRWLRKPLAGAGGLGVRFGSANDMIRTDEKVYYQEYIKGEPCAAVYLGDGSRALCVGVTRQLIGEPWLHAAPFHYCGSVGPLALSKDSISDFLRLGDALVRGFGLKGLFGVDCILQDHIPYPVEINPRYTASIEVLEWALGVAALSLHQQIFAGEAMPGISISPLERKVGKAILFARGDLLVPREAPWNAFLDHPAAAFSQFADIPHAGERIERGRPIVTLLASADSMALCMDELRQRAKSLDRWLFGP